MRSSVFSVYRTVVTVLTGTSLSMGGAGTAVALSFQDVPSNAAYAVALEKLESLKIVTGHRDEDGKNLGIFRPEDPAKLAEVLKMGMIAAKRALPPGIPSNLSAQGTWASPYVNGAAQLRFTYFRNNLENVFRTATRAEAERILSDAFGIPLPGKHLEYADRPITRGEVALLLARFPLGGAPVTTIVTVPAPVVTPPPASTPTPVATPAPTPTPAPVVTHPGSGQGVLTSAVNVRYLPDITSKSMGSYPAGTVVTILDDSKFWIFVRLPDGKEGYVSGKFVK